ncbi:8736_t:CDS:1, partial [Cetraspora pellucida]
NYWPNQINNSNFSPEDKDNLNKDQKNRIDELKQKQTNDTFDKIWQSILRETDINKLPTNRYWFIQIQNNQNLTENQKVRLNKHRIDKLKLLSNQLYDQISAEISKIDDYIQLSDERSIDHKIRSLNDKNLSGGRNTEKLQQERRGYFDLFLKEKALNNYDNYNKIIERYYKWEWVQELANSSPLANNIINLNQTLLSPEKNKKDLIDLRKL